MATENSVDGFFDGLSFADLEGALRRGDNLSAWNGVFEVMVERVAVAIRHRFPDAPFWEEAVQSAFRTLHRRVQAGQFQLDGPSSLLRLLVVIAHNKAARYYRQEQRQPGTLDGFEAKIADPRSASTETPEERGHQQQLLHVAMQRELQRILVQVQESLRKGLHQKILPLWLEYEYGESRLSRADIAARVGCTVATVDGVFRRIRAIWKPLVEEGLETLRNRGPQADAELEGRSHDE